MLPDCQVLSCWTATGLISPSKYNNVISPVKPKRASHHPSVRICFFADLFTVTVAMEEASHTCWSGP